MGASGPELTDDDVQKLQNELERNKLRGPNGDVDSDPSVPDLSDPLDLPNVDNIDEGLCEYINDINDALHEMDDAAVYNSDKRDDAAAGAVIIADKLGMDRSTVHYHLSGECVHRYNEEIDASQCESIRRLAEDEDITYPEIADLMSNCSQQQARYHAIGQCAHDVDADPVPLRHQKKS